MAPAQLDSSSAPAHLQLGIQLGLSACSASFLGGRRKCFVLSRISFSSLLPLLALACELHQHADGHEDRFLPLRSSAPKPKDPAEWRGNVNIRLSLTLAASLSAQVIERFALLTADVADIEIELAVIIVKCQKPLNGRRPPRAILLSRWCQQ